MTSGHLTLDVFTIFCKKVKFLQLLQEIIKEPKETLRHRMCWDSAPTGLGEGLLPKAHRALDICKA